ncbi:MAG: DUF262 domain-containing protein [Acutalibacteraceae bacterium]|nr:DUF262 domain-containing protein [Acutalibacteraceae bacterium]
MKAINTEFTRFLGAEAQYCVPIYQRKYSWDRDDCIKLLEDIIKVSLDENRPCHFIGSISSKRNLLQANGSHDTLHTAEKSRRLISL